MARIHQPIAWTAPQPNTQIIEVINNIAPPTTLIHPPASSSSLDSFPLPVISKNRDIPSSSIPITTPAISLYSNFHTTIVIAVCPRLDSDILIAENLFLVCPAKRVRVQSYLHKTKSIKSAFLSFPHTTQKFFVSASEALKKVIPHIR